MCKEDVRIKRRTASKTTVFTANNAAIAQLFAANPDRVAISIAIVNGGNPGASSYAVLRGGDKQTSDVIAAVSVWSPHALVTIEQLGILIQGPIWGQGNDAAAPVVAVTEVFFTEALQDV